MDVPRFVILPDGGFALSALVEWYFTAGSPVMYRLLVGGEVVTRTAGVDGADFAAAVRRAG